MSNHFYHYTSNDGVLGIVADNKIKFQLSEATYVNDAKEGLDIYEHFEKVLGDEKELTSAEREDILQYVKNNPWTYPVGYIDVETGTADIRMEKCRVFIMSFSTDQDSLPMWNYYGNHGYCLHFQDKAFHEIQKPGFFQCYHYFSFEAVTYLTDRKLEDLRKVISGNKGKKHCEEEIACEINRRRFFYKSNYFQYEQEHRLLIAIPETKFNSLAKSCIPIKHKNKADMVQPYIEIELNTSDKKPLLDGITIGPLNNSQMAINGLSYFLRDRGHIQAAANLSTSKAPLNYL